MHKTPDMSLWHITIEKKQIKNLKIQIKYTVSNINVYKSIRLIMLKVIEKSTKR